LANVAVNAISREVYKTRVFKMARQKADELGLPLVNYGCKYRFIRESDYNLDIVPRPGVPRFMLVEPDSQRLPFPDKSVVIFCSHVLEHVDNPAGLLNEFARISDWIYLVLPNPLGLDEWLYPEHKRMFIGNHEVRNPQSLVGPLVTGMGLIALCTSI